MRSLSKKQIRGFQKCIWDFYAINKRKMPWRNTRDPYKILVSEIMLQQTRVETVLKKYPEFVKKFPNFSILAKAPLPKILQAWQGLGYNRRAIALRKSAQIIIKKYNGKVPKNSEALEQFPGIGPATARSILVFAFNSPVVFIETNIRRVYLYYFFKTKKKINDRQIIPLIEKTLPKKNVREWYFALMDYGTWLGRNVKNPNKQSVSYRKQKPFKGSVREIRGNILKMLLANSSLSFGDIQMQFPRKSQKYISKTLFLLEKEGFILKQGKQFTLSR
jgi:A/G-specific adenine glycosylase